MNDITEQEINMDSYEVVRQDFFFSQEEPQITFNKGYAYINGFGLRLFEGIEYIQLLVDKQEKTIIIKPSEKKIKDSFRWSTSGKKRKPRHMRCIPLFQLIFEIMNWNTRCRYRITGFMKYSKGEKILYFDLKEAICFEPTEERDTNGRIMYSMQLPESWKYSFGIKNADYEQEKLVSIHEDNEIYEVKLNLNNRNMQKLKSIDNEEM